MSAAESDRSAPARGQFLNKTFRNFLGQCRHREIPRLDVDPQTQFASGIGGDWANAGDLHVSQQRRDRLAGAAGGAGLSGGMPLPGGGTAWPIRVLTPSGA